MRTDVAQNVASRAPACSTRCRGRGARAASGLSFARHDRDGWQSHPHRSLMAADWMSSGFAFEAGDRRTLAEQVLDRTVWSGWHSGAEPRALLEGWSPHAASRPDCIPGPSTRDRGFDRRRFPLGRAYAVVPKALEISVSVAFSASLTCTPPPSDDASATLRLISVNQALKADASPGALAAKIFETSRRIDETAIPASMV